MKNKKTELILIIIISFISLFFWDTEIVYPIKLFIVLIHEINHVMAAILTGGGAKSIILNIDLSGSTITYGGNQIIIAAAGYLGSLLIGAILYLSSFNKKLWKWISKAIAIIITIVSINLIQGGLQIFLSLVIAAIFFFLPIYLSKNINEIFLKLLGLTSCLYVIADIKQDLLTTSLRETDTQILEYLTDIPSLLIGFIWFLISIIIVYGLIRISFRNIKKS